MTGFEKTKRGGFAAASFHTDGSRHLDLRQAAVDGKFRTSDERGILRRKEGHGSGDLRRLPDSLHGHLGDNIYSQAAPETIGAYARALTKMARRKKPPKCR